MEASDQTTQHQTVEELRRLADELKQAKETAEKNAEMYRFLAEHSVDAVWLLDNKFHFIYAAPAAEKIAGYRPDEMVGRWLFEFLTPASVEIAQRSYAARKPLIDSGQRWGSTELVVEMIRKDGSLVWVEVVVNPIFDDANRLLGYNGVTRDATVRKRQETELQAKIAELTNERAFSQAVLESVPGLLYLYDAEGRLVRWNKNHETVTGFTAEELANMRLTDWCRGDEETSERITRTITRAFAEGASYVEADMWNKSGGKTAYYFTAVRTIIDGKPYIVGIGLDVSEQKRAAAALHQKEEELLLSYEKLTASHEELIATEEELRQQYDEVQTANTKISRQNAVLSILHETALGLLSHLNIADVLDAIATRLAELAGTKNVFVFLVDKNKRHAVRVVGQGVYAAELGFSLSMDSGLFGEVYRRKQTTIVDDYCTWEKRIAGSFRDALHAAVQVPLIVDGEVIGSLGLAHTEKDQRISPDDVALIERFADIAAIAIDNARSVRQLQESKDTIEEIFNAVKDVIVVIDGNTGELKSANRQTGILFGRPVDDILAAGFAAVTASFDQSAYLERVRKTIDEGPQLFEWELDTLDGRHLILELQTSPAIFHGEERCLIVMRDITQRRQMEKDFAALEEHNRAIVEALPDIIVRQNRQGDFLYYRVPNCAAFANLPDPPVGKNARDFFSPERLPVVFNAIEQALQTGQHVYETKLAGQEVYVEARYVKINNDEVLVIVRDITAKYKMEERLNFLREIDLMTGVYNRSFFETDMARMRIADFRGIGMLVCDVDGLKFINDTLGHRQGDELLQIVAAILNEKVEKPNYVARIGGDEFVVVLFDWTRQRLEELERHYRAKVAEYNQKNPHLPLSMSFGWETGESSNMELIFKSADNNMYRQKMHQTLSVRGSIVQLMMKALEAKDHVTEGHVERLGYLMEKMGLMVGLSQGELADLRLLAKFHDIGKVGIPENILNKPGRLTQAEMKIMRQHSEIGYRIARAAPDLEPIADWILKHQEHWDGRGYPLGLKGELIPIQCRILAIVDAYDAMISNRPYRKAMNRDDAITEILRCSGTQFDPQLVDVFLELLTQETD